LLKSFTKHAESLHSALHAQCNSDRHVATTVSAIMARRRPTKKCMNISGEACLGMDIGGAYLYK